MNTPSNAVAATLIVGAILGILSLVLAWQRACLAEPPGRPPAIRECPTCAAFMVVKLRPPQCDFELAWCPCCRFMALYARPREERSIRC